MNKDERVRQMYQGGRPNASARRSNGVMASLAGVGLFGWWVIRLETVNPRSRTPLVLPLVTARVQGRRYLVSMLGQSARWVRNVRAADGRVSIRCGRLHRVQLVEVPVPARAPILKNYLGRAPGARPHIPVDKDAALAEFSSITADYPVFEILPQSAQILSTPDLRRDHEDLASVRVSSGGTNGTV